MNEITVHTSQEEELAELRREVVYLRQLSERTTARMFRLDLAFMDLRHELEQRRRGFRLMAELAGLPEMSNQKTLFSSVCERITATLGMQRTLVLVPAEGDLFSPAVSYGYSPEEAKALAAQRLHIPPEFLIPNVPVLVTGEDCSKRFGALREMLGIPYLISAPIFLQGRVTAILITGRLREQVPYPPRLGQGDAETVQTVCAHLVTLLAGSLMAEAEQRTKIMLDSMPSCCSFWDEDHNQLDCNEAAARLFSVSSKEEYLAKFIKFSPVFQPDGRPSAKIVTLYLNQAFETGYLCVEWMHQTLSGELIPTEVTLVRVLWGRKHFVLAYTRDLREQKIMLAAMQKNQDELRLARDVAEKSAKAKSEFLANMSHEIRTPMNAILGMIHLLTRTRVSKKQGDYLEKAEHSASLLLRIINDILDFSALEAGTLQMEDKAFSLRDMMRHVHDIVRGEACAKSLRLYTHIDESAADSFVGDSLRLEQILLHLINNAVKFTPSGGNLSLRVYRDDAHPGRETLRFEVRDSGIGMTPEQVDSLFSPFQQADSSATRRYGGAGLGLAVSRRLVQLMGGVMHCASEEGKGSVFSIDVTLPLAEESIPVSEEGVSLESEAETPDSLSGLRVLLAEDNALNRMIAEELLQSRKILVRSVETGKEALDALAEESFDLVLMDIQMPVMDGLTAVSHIRENPALKGLPVIAMTAHAMTGDRDLSLKSGMSDHVTKPIDPAILYTTLRYWDPRFKKVLK